MGYDVLAKVAEQEGIGKYELPTVEKMLTSVCKVTGVDTQAAVASLAKNAAQDADMKALFEKMLANQSQENSEMRHMFMEAMKAPPHVVSQAPSIVPVHACSVM